MKHTSAACSAVRFYFRFGWILSAILYTTAAAEELCRQLTSKSCTFTTINATVPAWERQIVAAIETKYTDITIKNAQISSLPGAAESFVQTLSGLGKELQFYKYHDRVFFISQKSVAAYVTIWSAPELQQLQVQPNDYTQTLYICNTGLAALPPGLRGLPKLEDVYVQKNQLTQLNLNSFSSLQKLKRVDVSFNRINLLQKANHTVSIKTLSIGNNLLTVMNMDFFERIVDLKSLYLNDNQIARIDSTKPLTLSSLGKLSLAYNELSTFQPLLVEFPALTTLSLEGNHLTAIPRNLAKYSALELINLSANKLTRVDLTSIQQARNLRQLELAQNNIAIVSASTPFKHENLYLLGLDENKVSRLNMTGCVFPQLEFVHLGRNQLPSVPGHVFEQFPSARLYMWGMPMRCDDLMKYQKQLKDGSLIVDPLWGDTTCLAKGTTIQITEVMKLCCT